MPELNSTQWMLIGLLLLFNVVSAVRVYGYMVRAGRRPWGWVVVTVLFTALPYTVYAILVNFGWLFRPAPPPRRSRPVDDTQDGADDRGEDAAADASEATRCPHCGHVLQPGWQPATGPAPSCPRCGMSIREDRLA